MKRIYELVMEEHLASHRQMVFIAGPRQVGKTFASLEVSELSIRHFYLNWDIQEDRLLILQGANAVAAALKLTTVGKGIPIIIFDELHKYPKWKSFLKGFFDKYSNEIKIIVTGSAKLNIYKEGGDSLMGRYFLYRLHPLSISEILHPQLIDSEIHNQPKEIGEQEFEYLMTYGGFPEPYLKQNKQFYNRWKRLRTKQLFQEDLRDLTKIYDIAQIQVLAELLRYQAGQLTSYTTLSKKVNVSIDTIRRWLKTLQSFYYCFAIQPWTKNVTRTLLKEPKIYLWDWSLVDDEGGRIENFVASHLLKAVHFWTDRGLGEYGLYFLRDKEKREVDFLISKNGTPWIMVEVKKSENAGLSKSFYHFHNALKPQHAFQVVFDMDYIDVDCFSLKQPMVVPAKTFLSQLV